MTWHHHNDQHQQRPTKTSKEWQGEPMPQHRPLSVGLYLYPFQTSHVLSSVYFSKTSHALFSSLLPEKHHVSVLSQTSYHVSASQNIQSFLGLKMTVFAFALVCVSSSGEKDCTFHGLPNQKLIMKLYNIMFTLKSGLY